MNQPILNIDISNTGLQEISDWYYANIKTPELVEFKEMEADQLNTVCQLFMADYQSKNV